MKNKIEGVDNKELLIFGIIIGVIIILLIFELFFFEGRTEVIEERALVNAQLEEKQKVTVEAEQKIVYQVLNEIISKMNNKQYKELYDMLKDDYKNYYFADYESFEEFIKIYASQEYFPKYGSYYRDGDLYYVIVDFLQKKYTREEFLAMKVNKVDTIVLEEDDEGNFKFAMNGFVENIEHNNSKTVDGVTFILQNSVRNTETMKTTVLVKNDSEKNFSMSTSNLQVDVTRSNTAKLSTTNFLFLEPGEIGTLTIEYYFQYNSGRKLNGVIISGAKFDDGTVIEDVYLAK